MLGFKPESDRLQKLFLLFLMLTKRICCYFSEICKSYKAKTMFLAERTWDSVHVLKNSASGVLLFYCSHYLLWQEKNLVTGKAVDVASALGRMGCAPFGFIHCLSHEAPDWYLSTRQRGSFVWAGTLASDWRVYAELPVNEKCSRGQLWPPSSRYFHHLASSFPPLLWGSIGSASHRAASIESSSLCLVTLGIICTALLAHLMNGLALWLFPTEYLSWEGPEKTWLTPAHFAEQESWDPIKGRYLPRFHRILWQRWDQDSNALIPGQFFPLPDSATFCFLTHIES